MLGIPDMGKLSEELQKFHELTDQTANLVDEVKELNVLIKQLIATLEQTNKKLKK